MYFSINKFEFLLASICGLYGTRLNDLAVVTQIELSPSDKAISFSPLVLIYRNLFSLSLEQLSVFFNKNPGEWLFTEFSPLTYPVNIEAVGNMQATVSVIARAKLFNSLKGPGFFVK